MSYSFSSIDNLTFIHAFRTLEVVMAVVPMSQFVLGKHRQNVEKAFEGDDWSAVQKYEPLMMRAVDVACEDPERHMPTLLREVAVTLSLYQKLVDACRLETQLGLDDGLIH